ncbi:sugar MFS transporter [Mucilaginibacter sp. L3T2-6]|uniref:MFS transporter n=1 Tax=Mucilaginibacter sp. L3T2-6 TaxID=3062491 RepID=UPI002674FB69|nr:MFS transporter [Mucilaginibacter sp. L3T2-6]MDO3644127.1 MFS transporter [Mucilaginibacter sp. L3T2-6]MDV6216592.1 MFS transporter [Mucilaginibacter sp. L3T2-6]
MQSINRTQLFRASCLSLLVTSLSFGIRAGLLDKFGTEFHLDKAALASITATAFYGFPIAVVIGGMIVDIIGMKRLLSIAFLFHLVGILLTIFAQGFWTLYISTFLIGLANGTVEAACNPLVTSLYTDNKTIKLNHFHLWFPGGIVIGTLVVSLFDHLLGGHVAGKLIWQIEVGVMLIPTLIYGYLFSKLDFPVTERVSSGITTGGMYKALVNPLFLFMFILMFGTAITELFTGQWIDVLLKNVTKNAILLLALENGVVAMGRGFAKPILKMVSPQVLLLCSAILAALGIYLLSTVSGDMLIVAAIIFGMGVCFFWPTMLGFVNTNLPNTGAVGLNLMGGAGMFAVSIYTIFMGRHYDEIVAQAGGSNATAGQQILQATLVIPLVLIVAFIGLIVYMRSKNKTAPMKTAAV